MKARKMLFSPEGCIVAQGEAIPLSIDHPFGSYLVMLGASVPVSAPRGQQVTSCTVCPDREGVIAVAVKGDPSGSSMKRADTWHGFLIPIIGSANGFELDLKNMFVPEGGRLGAIVDSAAQPNCDQGGYISVTIDGVEYASMVPQWMDRPNLRHVDNPDLLCRYLDGTATAEEVRAADLDRQSRQLQQFCLERAVGELAKIQNFLKVEPESSPFDAVIRLYGQSEDQKLAIAAGEEASARLDHAKNRLKIMEHFLVTERLLEEGTETADLAGELLRRGCSLVTLAHAIRKEWSDGRWGLWSRLGQHYEAYRKRAGNAAYFAPEKK